MTIRQKISQAYTAVRHGVGHAYVSYMRMPRWSKKSIQYGATFVAGMIACGALFGGGSSSDRTQQIYDILNNQRPQIAHTAFRKGAETAERQALETIAKNPTLSGDALKAAVDAAIEPGKDADDRYTRLKKVWKTFPD